MRDVGGAINQIPDMSLFSNSGTWCKLPNGIIFQWGNGSGLAQYTISFPIIFPNACLQLVATPDGTLLSDANLRCAIEVSELFKTGFTASCFNATGQPSPVQKLSTRAIHWIAIGY